KQLLDIELAGLCLDVLDESGADALVLEAAVDADRGQLRLSGFGIQVQRGARHWIAGHLQDEEVVDLSRDVRLSAPEPPVRPEALLDEGVNGADVLALGAADRLVFVGVDDGADALVAEALRQHPLLDAAIDDMDARHPALCRSHRLLQLRKRLGRHLRAALLENALRLLDRQVPEQRSVAEHAGASRQVDQLDRLERTGDLDGDMVGVEAISVALPIVAQRRDDGDDVVGEQGVQHAGIDTLDAAGELVIDALQYAS